jgi:flagellar biosynthesis protein FlhF
MRLKLFHARVMSEAMAQVRAELGADALILATRRMGDGVEVTAALEPDDGMPMPLDRAVPSELDFHRVPPELRAALQRGDFEEGLRKTIKFAALPLEQPLLLVGPPGAGKTLTVARLATRLVMTGVAPLVITADGERAGATEQLAAFTRLLGVGLVVACHPVTLGRAVARREGASPVLIDSPGGDPRVPAHAELVAAFGAVVGAVMVVVLPAGLDPAEASDLGHAYAAIGARFLVATRLDLTRRLGGVLAAASAGLALAEAGVGPGAADGLLPITPAWLATRLQTGSNP